jgi:hypothetical protein
MKSETKAQRSARRKQQRAQRSILLMVGGGVILLAVAAFAILQNRPEPKIAIEVTGAPSLKVDQEKIDLGDVRLGDTVSASFRLTNVGDQPLEIVDDPYIEVVEGC